MQDYEIAFKNYFPIDIFHLELNLGELMYETKIEQNTMRKMSGKNFFESV